MPSNEHLGLADAPAETASSADLLVADATLPLCSFGPGGSYIVDWQVLDGDLSDGRRVFPPRTLGSALYRFAGSVLGDMKGWLLAAHPGRAYRADHCPAALEPCAACGHEALWPRWFAVGYTAPPWSVQRNQESPEAPLVVAEPEVEEDAGPSSFVFPLSPDLEPIGDFQRTPAGKLLARLNGPLPALGHAGDEDSRNLNTEYSNDPDPQTTQNSRGNTGFPRPARLFADHAGTGGSARRVQGDHLRARRGARTKGTHPAGPQQGSLFGSLADDQAA